MVGHRSPRPSPPSPSRSPWERWPCRSRRVWLPARQRSSACSDLRWKASSSSPLRSGFDWSRSWSSSSSSVPTTSMCNTVGNVPSPAWSPTPGRSSGTRTSAGSWSGSATGRSRTCGTGPSKGQARSGDQVVGALGLASPPLRRGDGPLGRHPVGEVVHRWPPEPGRSVRRSARRRRPRRPSGGRVGGRGQGGPGPGPAQELRAESMACPHCWPTQREAWRRRGDLHYPGDSDHAIAFLGVASSARSSSRCSAATPPPP